MGIKSAFREIVQPAGRRRLAVGNRTAVLPPVGGTSGPKIWARASEAMGKDRFEADEKIIRAGLVADEWDGTTALLSRLA
jgi:hypothetical protein